MPRIKHRHRRQSVFDGPKMGAERLDKIVREQLEKRAVRYSSTGSKSGTSARTLVRQVFQNYDLDKNGTIDLHEFTKMLRDFGVRNINQEDVNNVFLMYDKDGDGTIDYQEMASLFGESFTDEKGLLDMPSTLASHETRFMSLDQQKHAVKQDMAVKLTQGRMKMRDMFDALGAKNGIIDRDKLKRSLRHHYAIGIGLEPAVNAMLKEIDQNEDGRISFEEFQTAFGPPGSKKFKRKKSINNGPRMGWQYVDKIVKEGLEKRAVKYSSVGSKAGASAHTLIRQVFQKYDVDKSGSIDLEEFTQMIHDWGVRGLNQQDVNECFNQYDGDGNGTIDYKELASLFGQSFSEDKGIIDMPSTLASHETRFMSLDQQKHQVKQDMATKMKLARLNMEAMFNSLGAMDGIINRDKLKSMLRHNYAIGIGLEPAVDAMLTEIDKNDDGRISFEEFQTAFAPGQRKFKRKKSINNGPRMGWQYVDKIVKEGLEKRAVKYSSVGSKAGASAHTLIRQVFQKYDVDKSGTIDLEEFTRMIHDWGVRGLNQQDVNECFHQYDGDGNGTIDYKELASLFGRSFSDEKGIIDLPSTLASHETRFMSLDKQKHHVKQDMATKMKQGRMNMEDMFNSLGGVEGEIHRHKLKLGLRSQYAVGIGLEPAVDAMLNEIDKNEDGMISLEEFSSVFAPGKFKKYRRKQSVFDGPRMGWQRLDKIVQEGLEKRAVKYSSVGSKAGKSSNTLIRQVFKHYDKDNSGTIDLKEFTQMIRDWGVRNINQQDIDDLFRVYDKSGDGEIDYKEMAAMIGENFSDEIGIIDMPSTISAFETKFMSAEAQRDHILDQILDQMKSYRKHAVDLARETLNDDLEKIDTGLLKRTLRSRYQVGIGFDAELDRLLKEADNESGEIDIDTFFRVFFPDEVETHKFQAHVSRFKEKLQREKKALEDLKAASKAQQASPRRGNQHTHEQQSDGQESDFGDPYSDPYGMPPPTHAPPARRQGYPPHPQHDYPQYPPHPQYAAQQAWNQQGGHYGQPARPATPNRTAYRPPSASPARRQRPKSASQIRSTGVIQARIAAMERRGQAGSKSARRPGSGRFGPARVKAVNQIVGQLAHMQHY